MPGTRDMRQPMTLIASATGFVIVLLDVSVVNVALEAFHSDFNVDVAGLQWIVNAYTLVFASLLLTAGALGDRYGARRIFVCGLVVFTVASAVCGIAGSFSLLIAARAVQGAGAAMLVPNSLSLLQHSFTDEKERAKAVGWWGASGGIALAAGPVIGGLLVTRFGWQSIFLVNLPIGCAGLAIALTWLRKNPANPDRAIDLPGQFLAISTLGLLVLTLTDGGRFGWTEPRVIAEYAATVLSATAFVAFEMRSATPMLPMTLFASPSFTIASVCGIVVNFAYYGLIFALSLFFQLQQHLTPEQTGFAFLPMTVVLMIMNIVAGRIIWRLGARRLLLIGLTLAACGYAALMTIQVDSGSIGLAIPMLVAASGTALLVPTMTNLTLASVDRNQGGIASGVLNSARQIGGLVGVEIFGYLVRDSQPEGFLDGLRLSLGIAVALIIACMVLTAVLLRERRGPAM